MKNLFTYAGVLLAALLAVSCHTPEDDSGKDPEPPAPDPIVNVTPPGLYGIGGKDYPLGTDGWNQSSFLTAADGTVCWRLLNAGSLSALTLTGAKADARVGDKLTLQLTLIEQGKPAWMQNCQASLISVADDCWWYKVSDKTYFVLKKEASL